MRTLNVKGTGRVSKSPDMIAVNMDFYYQDKIYENTLNGAQAAVNELKQALNDVGFENKDIKISRFSISPVYKYVEEDRIYETHTKRVLEGYGVSQHLKIKFCLDFERLEEIVSAINSVVCPPEIDIGFSIGDRQSVEEQLLRKASEDARRKAEILASASGLKLGEIIEISYDWSEISLRCDFSLSKADCSGMISDFEPEEMEIRIQSALYGK